MKHTPHGKGQGENELSFSEWEVIMPEGYRKPRKPFTIPDRVAKRAAENYEIDTETGCWISNYSTASHRYGQVAWHEGENQRNCTAHRAAYVHHSGEQIPEGMVVDHMCSTRRCVNPDHLRLLTNAQNAARANGADWPLGECKHGHPDSERRTYGTSTKTYCSVCRLESQRRYRARKKNAYKGQQRLTGRNTDR